MQEASNAVLRSGEWRRYEGSNCLKLVELLSQRSTHPFGQLTASGTAALEILLRAAGISSNDEVLLSCYDYPGNFWAIERVGARPVLVDTQPNSWRLSLSSLDEAYSKSCKALVVSHLHGQLQHIDKLRAWCDERRVVLIEDACQALGASWRERPIGSFGHAAVYSFGGGKLLSCGRGGAWTTADEALATKARIASGAGSGPYAMSELQAAIVCAQWSYLEELNAATRNYFQQLAQELAVKCPSWTFGAKDDVESTAFYQCGWIANDVTADQREELVNSLRNVTDTERAAGRSAVPIRELPFGNGFPGFHRRTSRRCRRSGTLENAISAATQTIVLHHSEAVEQPWSVDRLADWIKNKTDSLRRS